MRNPKITNENYNIELPLSIEETEVKVLRDNSPTFKPYNNLQSFAIFDVQDLFRNIILRV